MVSRKYITVEINEDVDVPIADILDGMDEDDLAELRDEIDKQLKRKAPDHRRAATEALGQAVFDRHSTHPGPIWMCPDPICAAFDAQAVD